MNYNNSYNDTLRVCLGDTLYLKDDGSVHNVGGSLTSFRFFEDGNQLGTLSAQTDSLTYVATQSGITEVKYYVIDGNGCTSAHYSLFIITHEPVIDFLSYYESCPDDSLHLSFEPASQDTSIEFSRVETNELGCMMDSGVQSFNLNVSGVSPATISAASDINFIRIAMEHNRVGELGITVECPNAQSITLLTPGTGQFEDFGDPIWGNGSPAVDCNDITTVGEHFDYDFGGPNAWGTVDDYIQNVGGNIPGGDYLPDNDFSGLIGCPTNGTWVLTITDNQNGNDGSIGNFAIDFNTSTMDIAPAYDISYDPNAANSFWSTSDNFSYMSADLDTLIYSNSITSSNSYTYQLTDDFGCIHTFDTEYEVVDAPLVSAGSDGTFCEGVTLNGIVTNVGTSCEVFVEMYDDWGDGWQGNELAVTVGGNTTNYTGIGAYSNASFTVPTGSTISFTYNSGGGWPEETSYYIIVSGDTLFSDGLGGIEPTASNEMLLIDCASINSYWTPDDGSLSDVNVLDPEVITSGTMEFVLHYEDAANPTCGSTDTVNIVVNENPTIQDTTFSGCFTDNVTVDPNPTGGLAPYVTNWYGEDPGNLTSGQYLYTVIDANNCSSSQLIYIAFSDSMYFSNVQVTDANCFGEASGTIYFLFNGGESPITFDWGGVNFNQIPAGNHQLIAIDSIGCRDTLDYTVGEPTEMMVSGVVTDVQTQDDGEIDLTVSGGTGTYTYMWNNGATTEDITGLPGGDFIVSVMDSLGCEEIDTFTVVDPFLSIDENSTELFSVYPNPTNGLLNIQLSQEYENLIIEVFDMKGLLVESKSYDHLNTISMDLSQLNRGTYILRLKTASLSKVFKIEKE
jgi:subtilisin-like proprotein convertase family protein